ncbi:hypothetical protein GOP47_0018355 [Adiantum capillus-veneris]|uniref:XS domain-containing protein n=2 Tax=Adiantum capillus-veneris TaxID=13818 RepID=A0A9D4UHL3_ADICA|nr:hypothetical protein GOP47_0018355 [Adiantum capillus-veneris]
MSRRDFGSRERDSHRDGRHDVGRNVRYPLHPLPLQRERTRGDSPRNRRMRSVSPQRPHRDRLPSDFGGRNGHRDSSPRQRHSRTPSRVPRHGSEVDSLRGRSPDGYRRRSLESQDLSRDRRIRSPPRLAGRASPPRLALRTPPRPRSPRASMHPVSPRYSMRPVSPRARMLLASPRSSLRPVSPRLALRAVSPQVSMRPRSPQVSMRPPRRPSPLLTSAFDREQDRHAHDAILASRNGPILALQNAPALGSAGTDVLNKQEDETLSGSGMLVTRPIYMNDGRVETIYALPPDPVLNPLQSAVDSALGGQVLPSFSDGLSQYNTEPASLRYSGLDKYVPIERDFLASQDQILLDRTLPGQSQYVSGDRSLPDYPYPRDRPLSPRHNMFERPLQRRGSRSPLRGGDSAVSLSKQAGYASEFERASRRINYDKREPIFPQEAPFREGFNSPHRSSLDQDYTSVTEKDAIGYGRGERNGEIWRMSGEGRMTSPRYSGSVYNPPRQRGLARSPELRGSSRFETRKSSFQRQARTPPRESSRHDDFLQRHADHRSAMRRYPSPDRIGRLSPRRMRSLTPPNLRKHSSYEEERRAWKRKFIEMGGEPSLDHRNSRPLERDFKRRERDVGDFPCDRRQSGWDRKDGWLDRREDSPGRPGYRPIGERSAPPRVLRRHLDIHRKQLGRPNVDMNSASEQDKDEQDLPPDLPEDSPEFKQQVQRSLLKYAKILNEDQEQRKKYEEQGKAGTLLCIACGRLSKTFTDTHSLVMHTLQSQKKGLRAEHLGLCKAICSIMRWRHTIDPAGGKAYQDCSAEEAKSNNEDLILWPPAVIVHYVAKKIEGQQETVAESAVKDFLKDTGFLSERVKIAHGKGGTVIVKYSPLLPCLHDAESLHHHFASRNFGRDDWWSARPVKQESNGDLDPVLEDGDGAEKNMLYGYIALAQDLDKVDADLQRRCQVKSRKDIEAIIGDPLAAKNAED